YLRLSTFYFYLFTFALTKALPCDPGSASASDFSRRSRAGQQSASSSSRADQLWLNITAHFLSDCGIHRAQRPRVIRTAAAPDLRVRLPTFRPCRCCAASTRQSAFAF